MRYRLKIDRLTALLAASRVSQNQIFAATYRAMQRLGPGELTLAEIAAEAGVAAGALMQRFGSKRDLLLALSVAAAGSAGDLWRGRSRRCWAARC